MNVFDRKFLQDLIKFAPGVPMSAQISAQHPLLCVGKTLKKKPYWVLY